MRSILNDESYELVIKNSKFISVITKVETKEDVKKNLNSLKEKYKNATHYCYAYKLIGEVGFSDDKEPAKTAGSPILQEINSSELINVLVVVIRYFGGIKLGPGGLIRAYSKSSKEVINKSKKINLTKGYVATIKFSYNYEKEINYLLKDVIIKEKKYTDVCTYIIEIEKNMLKSLPSYIEIKDKYEKIIPKLN